MNSTIDIPKLDLPATEAKLLELTELWQNKQKELRSRIASMENEIGLTLNAFVKAQENHKITAHFGRESIELRYSTNVAGNKYNSIGLSFASKYDVYGFDNIKKEIAIKNNLELGKIHQIHVQAIRVNLTEKNDSIDELAYYRMVHYVAAAFEVRSYFILFLEKYYDELLSLWKEMDGISYKSAILKEKRDKHLLAVYEKEFTEMACLKKGNVILVKSKETDFVHFYGYNITRSGSKVYSYYRPMGETKYITSRKIQEIYGNKAQRFGLNITNGLQQPISKDTSEFYLNLAKAKLNGDKVEVMSLSDFESLIELTNSERESIIVDSAQGHFKEKSDFYEAINIKKNKR